MSADELLSHIHMVKRLLAGLPALEYLPGDAGDQARRTHDQALDRAVAAITAAVPKAKIAKRWDGAKVSIAGVRASSTSGVHGALTNWVAAAYRHLDKQATPGGVK